MAAFLTVVTETDGRPANEDDIVAGAKKVLIKKKEKQSYSQMYLQKRKIASKCACCGVSVSCD